MILKLFQEAVRAKRLSVVSSWLRKVIAGIGKSWFTWHLKLVYHPRTFWSRPAVLP